MQTMIQDVSIPTIPRSFDDLMRGYYRKAYIYAYRIAGNREDAEDLTQEAFLRAYKALGSYDTSRPFERWLFRIIANLFVDSLRSRKRQVIVSLDSPYEAGDGNELFTQIADESADPAKQMMENTMDEKLQRAMNMLPIEFRRTVILTDIEGLSYEEAAAVLGCAVGTIRSRLHRARVLMRNAITGAPLSRRRLAAVQRLVLTAQ